MTTTTTPDKVESFAHEKLKGQYRTRYQTQRLLKFLADPENQLEKYDYEVLKPSQTQPVYLVPDFIENRSVVIKRYKTKNAWHALRRTVRQSRAENCWIYADILQNLGVAIAPPVAFIQEFLGVGLKGRSWYLSEFVVGPSWLDHLHDNSDQTFQECVVEQIIDTMQLLWKHHITHGDMKGSNIMLINNQIVVLDLDSAKQHRGEAAARQRIDKDMERFLRNLKEDHRTLYELAQKKLGEAGFSALQ